MENTQSKSNWFTRGLIILLCAFLAALIAYNFLCTEPKGEINSGILTLLCFLLILALSETFDSFSLGKLISITRQAQKKEKEVQKLEKDKSELINQLISISNSQQQSQQHTNVYGDYHASKGPSVQRASKEEVQANESSEQERKNDSTEKESRISLRDLESMALIKYINDKGIHKANVISEAKLMTQFHGIDPVCSYQPIFDCYYKEDNKEIFVEFKVNRGLHMMFRDRLYHMLSKINHYKNAKNVNTHLEFVWLNIPGEESRPGTSERLLADFDPAIASGLLKVSEINFTEEEIKSSKREV